MFEDLSKTGRGLIESTLQLYKDTNFAYGLAMLMAIAALIIVVGAVVSHFVQVSALNAKLRQISGFITLGGGGNGEGAVDPKEDQFARRFREIDGELSKSGVGSGKLGHAWRRYRRTLVIGPTPPVRSSQRPNAFFYAAVSPPTWLGFAATIFVGAGLLATFLGLVAALTFAADGMKSDNPVAMQTALRDLLGAASSKFITSVAGVGLSLLLRIIERLLAADLRRNVERLSAGIELGIRVDPDAHGAVLVQSIADLTGVARAPGVRSTELNDV